VPTHQTDVVRYPRPQRPDAAVIVAAESDAYVSTDSVRQLHAYWPGSELRLVSGGHVSAFLLHQPAFRRAVLDSLQRLGKT
jgi:predicted alpha/beta hydrolase family esterase